MSPNLDGVFSRSVKTQVVWHHPLNLPSSQILTYHGYWSGDHTFRSLF